MYLVSDIAVVILESIVFFEVCLLRLYVRTLEFTLQISFLLCLNLITSHYFLPNRRGKIKYHVVSEKDGGRRGLQSRDFCPYTLMHVIIQYTGCCCNRMFRHQCINPFIPCKRNKYYLQAAIIVLLKSSWPVKF